MRTNSNAYGVMLFLIYAMGSAVEEAIEHLLRGLTLNNHLPDNEIVYDSNFIHFIRLFVLGIVVFLLGIVGLILTVACCFAINMQVNRRSSQPSLHRAGSVVQSLKKVPYGELFFEEGRDCPVCLSSFENDEQIV